MKLEEFEKQAWKSGMRAKYHGGEFDIATVNFEESLIGLLDKEEVNWVRCENVELV